MSTKREFIDYLQDIADTVENIEAFTATQTRDF